jgi:hypothetical protein
LRDVARGEAEPEVVPLDDEEGPEGEGEQDDPEKLAASGQADATADDEGVDSAESLEESNGCGEDSEGEEAGDTRTRS